MLPSIEQFLQALAASGLFSEAEIRSLNDQLAAASSPVKDAQDLANRLIRAGRLNKFQAQAIAQGKAKGLTYGDYVILDRIGAGGMGQVFKAEHRRMKRVVALKLLPPSAMKSREAVKRFQREMEAAARLTHPNIVIAHDAGQAGGVHYLVMEYVEGSDLSNLVKQHGPLAVGQAVSCLVQAARGLEHAHAKGIVHRDIKPSNLLLDKEGTVKILDMGLARLDHPAAGEQGEMLTTTGNVMGTVDFMSPEQALDTKHADARSDIYSLGCTLYYLLTAKKPYDADTMMKKLLAHREQPVPALRAARGDVPHSLDEIYQRMVAKRPEDRFQTAAALREALEACLPGAEDSLGATQASAGSSDSDLRSLLEAGGAGPQTIQAPSATARDDTLGQRGTESPTMPSAASPSAIGEKRDLAGAHDLAGNRAARQAARGASSPSRAFYWAAGGAIAAAALVAGVLVALRSRPADEAVPVELASREPTAAAALTASAAPTASTTAMSRDRKGAESRAGGETPLPNGRGSLADPDRRAAEWALSVGATIGIVTETGKPAIEIKDAKSLPADRFVLEMIATHGPCPIRDADLANLEGLVGLRTISMMQCDNLTDAGMEHLRSLEHLESFNLPGHITDAGIAQLAGLHKLGGLGLPPGVTRKGLALLDTHALWGASTAGGADDLLDYLCSLPAVSDIMLYYSPTITDKGLGSLAHARKLRSLRLDHLPSVTDAGMANVAKATLLRSLTIARVAITDAGLASLERLAALTTLDLEQTKVTAAGVAKLQKALPKCKIEWDGITDTQSPADVDREFAEWARSKLDEIKKWGGGNTVLIVGDGSLNFSNTPGRGRDAWNRHVVPRKASSLFRSGVTARMLADWADAGFFKGLSPKLVIVKAGSNDRVDSADALASRLLDVAAKLRTAMPACRVLLLSVGPPNAGAGSQKLYGAANRILSSKVDGDHIRYVDTAAALLRPDGTARPELLDPDHYYNAEGFRVLFEALEPELASVFGPLPGATATTATATSRDREGAESRAGGQTPLPNGRGSLEKTGGSLTDSRGSPAKPKRLDPDRDAAEKTLKLQGRVGVMFPDGSKATLDDPAQLPPRGFTLVRLDLAGTACTDADLAALGLAELTGLKSLAVGGTKITPAALVRELAGSPSLQQLDASGLHALDDAAAAALAALPALGCLRIEGTSVTDAALAKLAGSKRLAELNVSGTKATAAGLAKLAGLRVLVAKGIKLSASDADALKHALPDCQIVYSAGSARRVISPAADERKSGGDADRSAAEAMLALGGSVSIAHGGKTEADLDEAGRLPAGQFQLQAVDMHYARGVRDADLATLAGLPALAELDLSGTWITAAGLAELSSTPGIRVLGLSNVGTVDDAILVALARWPALETLRLDGEDCTISDAMLGRLVGLKSLIELDVHGTRIGDSGLLRLAKLPKLKALNISCCKRVTPAGLAKLKQALPDCQIVASESNAGRTSTARVAGSPRAPTAGPVAINFEAHRAAAEAVVRLGGYLGAIYPDGTREHRMRAVADIPAHPFLVEWIVLYSRPCQDADLARIPFRDLRGLKTISFGGAGQEGITGEAIKGLAAHPTLRAISLTSMPKLGPEALQLLATCPALEWVQCRSCPLTASDVSLAHLAGLKTLVELDVEGCPVGDAGLDRLAGLPALRVVVGSSRVTRAGAEKLRAALPLCEVVFSEGGNKHRIIGPPDPPPPDQRSDVDRTVAEAMLKLGAWVEIAVNGQVKKIYDAASLPPGWFTVQAVDLTHARGVRNVDLVQLGALRGLETVSFYTHWINAAGLKYLARAPALRRIYMSNVWSVDDEALAALAHCPRIEVFKDNLITDTGLGELAEMKSLTELELATASISDAGLVRLAGMKQLRVLDLTDCKKLTPAGIEKLHQALPNCRITHTAGGAAKTIGPPP